MGGLFSRLRRDREHAVYDRQGWRPRWRDHLDEELSGGPVFDGCTAAVRALRDNPGRREPTVERVALPATRPAERLAGGLRAPVFVFFAMISRPFADVTVLRQLYASHAPQHLWLVHADLKMDGGALARLRGATAALGNVHFMAHRHSVQWGGFSMIDAMLDALATSLRGVSGPGWSGFDFFINLSDSDLLLRTEPELAAFFAPFAAARRSFVGVKARGSDVLRYEMHAQLRKLTFAQCGGRGFAILNGTASELFPHERRCCYGRSGTIIYGRVPFGLPALQADAPVLHGPQWLTLHASHAEALLSHPLAVETLERFRFTLVPDEAAVQTALMQVAELRQRLVNHNLRYIDWPHGHGSPEAYWQRVGAEHEGGPVLLTSEHAAEVFGSEAIIARKADPGADDGRLLALWDEWMARKLGRHARPPLDGGPSARRPPAMPRAERACAAPAALHAGAAAARAQCAAPPRDRDEEALAVRQPPIGASLLAQRADLSHVHVPPGPDEVALLRAGGLSAAEARAAVAVREASLQGWVPHYGRVDNLTKNYYDQIDRMRQDMELRRLQPVPEALRVKVAPQPRGRAPLPAGGAPPAGCAPSALASVQFGDGSWCVCEGPPCRSAQPCCADKLGPAGAALCGLQRKTCADVAQAPNGSAGQADAVEAGLAPEGGGAAEAVAVDVEGRALHV